MADKICPILMAGTMISNIDVIEVMKGHHLYYESVRCMGEKCEWFLNGCPAHLGHPDERVLEAMKPPRV